MENLKNRRAVDLVTSEEKLKKLAAQPSFKHFKIFHENLVAVEWPRVELTLNYVEFVIVDHSKTLMYDFHYNHIKRKYPDLTLLFTDIDSLTYQIQTDNVYEDFYASKHLFDFSGYEKEGNSIMKGELNREIIAHFVGLRAKMYSLKIKKEEMKKTKGVKKKVVKKALAIKTS